MSSNEAKVPSCNDWVTRMCQMMCDTIVIHYLKISDHISDRVGFLISGHILLENSLGANFSNGCVNYGFWIWHVATDANSWMIRVIQWKVQMILQSHCNVVWRKDSCVCPVKQTTNKVTEIIPENCPFYFLKELKIFVMFFVGVHVKDLV